MRHRHTGSLLTQTILKPHYPYHCLIVGESAQFTITFALVSVVAVAGFGVMTLTARNLRATDDQRSGSTRALVTANQLEQSVLDLETGLRGYLLDPETTIHIDQVNRAGDLVTLVLILGIGATVLFLGLVVLTSLRTQRALVAPLRRLAGRVSALTAGDLTARVPEGGAAEVGEVVQGFNRMADAPARQREALDDHQSELEAQAPQPCLRRAQKRRGIGNLSTPETPAPQPLTKSQ